jgi:hypothetical protein
MCLGLFLVTLSITGLKSQSLEFVTQPEAYLYGTPDAGEITSYAEVRNKSNNSVNVKVKITILSIAEGHMFYFCLGNCFPPRATDFEMPDGAAVTLAPGGTTTGPNLFDIILLPEGVEGVTSLKVTFMVVGNPTDTVEYTVTFSTVTDVDEINEPIIVFAEPVPNPVSEFVYFNYETLTGNYSGYLEIYDNSGILISQIKLTENKIEKYNTANLPSGTYYAVMNIKDKKQAVRKFVVSH